MTAADHSTDADTLEVEQTGESVDKAQSWHSVVWSNKKARVGIIILGLYVIIGIFSPLIAPHSPHDGSFAPLQEPSAEHLMGTTQTGRDIFSQIIVGTRVSLLVGVLAGVGSSLIAMLVGMTAGYTEGTIVDDVLMFITNVLMITPVLPLMLVLLAYTDQRGLWLIVLIVSITTWPGHARAKRAQIITLRNRDFITSAKFSGVGPLRIIFSEIMPNMTSLVAAGFMSAAMGAIGAEAALAVIGFGSNDQVSWGTVLYHASAADAVTQGLWVWVFVPGLVLALLIMAMNFVNFGIDLISNPHLRED